MDHKYFYQILYKHANLRKKMEKPILSAILSCSGPHLTDEEKSIFSRYNPFGICLFNRNIQNKKQIKNLCKEIRECVERENIFIIHLKNKGRDPQQLKLDMAKLVKATEGFSGAEIEEVVNEALFNAYANGQTDLEMKNLLECINATSPLSRTMAETISNLRKWADQRARFASVEKPEEVKEFGEDVPRLQQEYKNPFITKKKND